MAAVEDYSAPVGRTDTTADLPAQHRFQAAPGILYFHGGGLVMGTNHSIEPLARALAASRATVVAVGYRLAPECPPRPSSTTATATAWVADNAVRLGLDARRLAVAGDSAGGSLAAAVALAADHGHPSICCQVLLYPGWTGTWRPRRSHCWPTRPC